VGANILAGNVGAENLVSKRLPVEYEARLSGMPGAAILLRSEEDPKFEGHVEAW
jgi:hypothetical protein